MFKHESNTAYNNGLFSSIKINAMNEEMTRLYAAAKEVAGLRTQAELARHLNVSSQVVKNWETRGISKAGLLAAQEKLDCRAEWIERGVGPMRAGSGPMNAQDANVLAAVGPSRSYAYPEISEVQAGNAAEAIDLLQPGEGERHRSDAWAGENGFWLRVRGDSMTRSGSTSFPEGMIVLVAPGVEPRSGQFIVAKLGNDVTFKQFVVDAGLRYLKPLNSAFQQQVMDEKWQLVGTVVDAKWPKGVFS